MNKIKINKNDETAWMEEIIKKLIIQSELSRTGIMITPIEEQYKLISTVLPKEKQMTFILTIISILYKEKCYEEHLNKKLDIFDEEQEIDDDELEEIDEEEIDEDEIYVDSIQNLEEIISAIKQSLDKNIKETYKIMHKYSIEIEEYIKLYFFRKNRNYIFKKYDLDVIKEQNLEKDFIEMNLFNLNQLIYYNEEPLTKEEKIIAQIIEYYIDSKIEKQNKIEQLSHVKKLLKHNNTEEELNEIILFIIGNTYQEIEQDLTNEKRNYIMYAVENEKVQPSDFVSYFKENKKFSNTFLENFIEYNEEIKEGRLEELKTKESYERIKRLYKK